MHDVADIGVQVLSNLAVKVHSDVNAAIENKNQTGQFKITSQRFLDIINDTETLTSTQKGRLLGERGKLELGNIVVLVVQRTGSLFGGTAVAAPARLPLLCCVRLAIRP